VGAGMGGDRFGKGLTRAHPFGRCDLRLRPRHLAAGAYARLVELHRRSRDRGVDAGPAPPDRLSLAGGLRPGGHIVAARRLIQPPRNASVLGGAVIDRLAHKEARPKPDPAPGNSQVPASPFATALTPPQQ